MEYNLWSGLNLRWGSQPTVGHLLIRSYWFVVQVDVADVVRPGGDGGLGGGKWCASPSGKAGV